MVSYSGENGWTITSVLDWVAKSTTFAFDPKAVRRVAADLDVGLPGTSRIGIHKDEL